MPNCMTYVLTHGTFYGVVIAHICLTFYNGLPQSMSWLNHSETRAIELCLPTLMTDDRADFCHVILATDKFLHLS